MYGVDAFTPIVYEPQTAILGVGRIMEEAVPVLGRVEIKPRLQLSLTVDHRIVDGALAARFLERLRQLIENPSSLLV